MSLLLNFQQEQYFTKLVVRGKSKIFKKKMKEYAVLKMNEEKDRSREREKDKMKTMEGNW